MAVEGLALPALPVVITTALIDSVNPCAIGVLVLLITTLLALSHNRKRMLEVGMIYIIAVYVTYLAAGVGLLYVIQKLNIAEPLSIIVGGLIIVLGLLEIKDFWWYGKGLTLSIPARRAEQIKHYMKHVTVPSSIILGMFVAAVELPCTGGPYLAITAFLAKIGFNLQVLGLLLFYNAIFVLPLVVILLLVFFGVNVKSVQKWKQKQKRWMRLFMGILMIALGILLILWTKGYIGFVTGN